MAKKPRLFFDGVYKNGPYVKAWKEGRGNSQEIIVQIWKSGKAEGEPEGDWAMPAILGMVAIDQAIVQTK